MQQPVPLQAIVSVAVAALVVAIGAALRPAAPMPGLAFSRAWDGPLARDEGYSRGVAWGDYDGDGDPDLYVANGGGQWSFLYRNDSSRLTKMRGHETVRHGGAAEGASWIEPMNCTADARGGRCELWAPTQNPEGAAAAVERALGLPRSALTVHVTRSGGGFGRRYYSDFAVEAALVSRLAQAPVQVVWTREDDTRHGLYRPMGVYRMRGGLDASGMPVAWSMHVVNAMRGAHLRWANLPPGGGELRAANFPAAVIPHLRLAHTPVDSAIPRGQWRAVSDSALGFVDQCFLDELSHAGGRPRVHRVVCAIDCGTAVNPLGLRAQVEGSVAMGLSAALHEAITAEGGRVVQGNFHDYRVLRLPEMPTVEVHIVPSTEAPLGAGETALPPVAAALANALFAATGRRVRRLPIL